MTKTAKPSRRSISRTVSVALASMVAALLLISAVSFYGFYTISANLQHLSEQAVPKIVDSSLMARSINRLLSETERLMAAQSEPARRSSFAKISTQLEDLKSLLKSNENSASMTSRISGLNDLMFELNALVQQTIETAEKSAEAKARLLRFSAQLAEFKLAPDTAALSARQRQELAGWNTLSSQLIAMASDAISLKSLRKIKRAERNLRKVSRQLEQTPKTLPGPLLSDLNQMSKRLHMLVLGNSGVVPMLIQEVQTELNHAGRSSFARSLIDDTTSSMISDYNREVANVSDQTTRLTERGNIIALIFGLLAFASLILTALITQRIRYKLITRLTQLNDSILAKVDGQHVTVDVTGNDEITDMARSFIYYEGEVQSREAELNKLVMRDPLTGVSNRRYYIQRGRELIEMSQRYDHALSIFMLDIDHFKKLNDTYGHPLGDKVLEGVAHISDRSLRKVDVFSRIGGEEFSGILPECKLDAAIIVAERIREEIANHIWEFDDIQITCTVSIGVASFGEVAGDTLERLRKRADQALYAAKASGRNIVKSALDI